LALGLGLKYSRYGYLSSYLHWNPLTMGMAITDDGITIDELNNRERLVCLVFCYYAMQSVTNSIARHYDREEHDKIERHEFATFFITMQIVSLANDADL